MWTEISDGSGDSGGFDVASFESPTSTAKDAGKKKSRFTSIFPATISQILRSSEDDDPIVKGFEVGKYHVIGIVRKVVSAASKITYTIQDTTGSIQAVSYFVEDNDLSIVTENMAVHVFGNKKVFDNATVLYIAAIHPINSVMEIYYHHLEVIHAPFYAKSLDSTAPAGGSRQPGNSDVPPWGASATTSGNSLSANGDGYENTLNLNLHQVNVHRILKLNDRENGVHLDFICENLNGKMNQREIRNALDFLINEGHVFTTIDDSHFAVTDS